MGGVVEPDGARARPPGLPARVEAGEEVMVARGKAPVARSVPVARRADGRAAMADIFAARAGLAPTTANEPAAWRDEGRRRAAPVALVIDAFATGA